MAFTHVQTIGISSITVAALATITPSGNGGANFTTGSRVFCALQYFQAGNTPLTIVSVTNQSAVAITYAEPATQRFSTDTGMLVFDIPNMPAGVTSLLVTLSGTPAFGCNCGFSEYTGLATTAADGANSNSASASTATDNAVSGTASNAAQPGICWGACMDSVFNTIPAAGTGFTSRLGANGFRIEDKALSSTGSQQATFTNTHGSACNHIAYMIIADETGAGAASNPPFPWQSQGAMGSMVAM